MPHCCSAFSGGWLYIDGNFAGNSSSPAIFFTNSGSSRYFSMVASRTRPRPSMLQWSWVRASAYLPRVWGRFFGDAAGVGVAVGLAGRDSVGAVVTVMDSTVLLSTAM